MQKRTWGFTLLELMIVIVIIGVMATLGFGQYQSLIEKGRQAEAKEVIGMMRKQAYIYYMENNNNITGLDNASLGVGTSGIPDICNSSNYFRYGILGTVDTTNNKVSLYATRCTAGGKEPQGKKAYNVTLEAYLAGSADNTDTWKVVQ